MFMLFCDLQFMVREFIFFGLRVILMYLFFKLDQFMDVNWYLDYGIIYMDGCQV